MLRRLDLQTGKAFAALFEQIDAKHGRRPVRPHSLLNAVRKEIADFKEGHPNDKNLDALEAWLDEIDQALQDLRGFSPTVLVRFNANDPDSQSAPYDMGFVESYLGLPDFYDGEVLCYERPRGLCMQETPEPRSVNVLTPVGRCTIPEVWSAELLPKKYAEVVRKELRDKLRNGELTKLVNGFVRRTGLVVFDPKVSGLEHSHHCGSMVM
jgi:hypothetical protein